MGMMQETAEQGRAAGSRSLPDRAPSESTRPELSIVVPVYNEAAVIEPVVDELASEVHSRIDNVELVLVDDASTDATPEILDRIAASDPRVKVHHAEQNGG